MGSPLLRRCALTLVLLLAFVALGILAVLPHTHAGTQGSHSPHACALCRAQTAPPHVAPPAIPSPVFQPLPEAASPWTAPLVAHGAIRLPASRAPPLAA